MAVYTHIEKRILEAFLEQYDLGKLKSFEGIQKGVSNSNFHVFTTKGRYILTAFEEHRTKRSELPFFFALSDHLNSKGILSPQALPDKTGEVVHTIANKPVVMIGFLKGEDIPRGKTNADHCAQMGKFTAQMHKAGESFKKTKTNRWAMTAWRPLANKLKRRMEAHDRDLEKLVYDELAYIEKNWPKDLPKAAIHADMFPDNIFFKDGKISAVIDLYFACTEAAVFDLSIVINAWCFDLKHAFDEKKFKALMGEYEKVRPLSVEEKSALRIMCRGTALRYLLSRLEEWFNHKHDTLMTPHDPGEYLTKLKFHQSKDIFSTVIPSGARKREVEGS